MIKWKLFIKGQCTNCLDNLQISAVLRLPKVLFGTEIILEKHSLCGGAVIILNISTGWLCHSIKADTWVKQRTCFGNSIYFLDHSILLMKVLKDSFQLGQEFLDSVTFLSSLLYYVKINGRVRKAEFQPFKVGLMNLFTRYITNCRVKFQNCRFAAVLLQMFWFSMWNLEATIHSKTILKIFAKVAGKHLCQESHFAKIFQSSIFSEHL